MANHYPSLPEMDPVNAIQTLPKAPNGYFAGKVDEAGRIKLPAEIRKHLAQMPDASMFATYNDPDKHAAKIYFNAYWDKIKAKLDAAEDAEEAMAFMRVSNYYGGDVEIDSNGRVTLPQELRAVLQLKDTAVQLLIFGEILHITPAEELKMSLPDDMALLRQAQAKKKLGAIGAK